MPLISGYRAAPAKTHLLIALLPREERATLS